MFAIYITLYELLANEVRSTILTDSEMVKGEGGLRNLRHFNVVKKTIETVTEKSRDVNSYSS